MTEERVLAAPSVGFWRERRWELLGAVGVWLFGAFPLLTGKVLLGFDTYAYSSPSLAVTFRAWRNLSVPQWNPDAFGGVPHLANSFAGVFDPLKLPFVAFDADRAVMLITAFHLLLLAVGLVVLAARVRLRPPSGIAMVVVVLGSGMAAGKALQFEQLLVVALIPWFLAAIDLVLDPSARRRRAIGWLALSTAVLLVAGHPQAAVMALALGTAWAISRALARGSVRSVWLVVAGVALGGVAAAVQLLPTLLFLDGAETLDRGVAFFGNPTYVLQRRLVPLAVLGDVTTDSTPGLSGTFEAMSYVGVVAVALGLSGVVDGLRRVGQRAATLVLLAAGAGALLLTFGSQTPIYEPLADVIPFMNQIRVPARWVVVVVFVIALFAGQGVDTVVRRASRETLVWVGGILAVGALVVVVGPFVLPSDAGLVVWVVLALATVALMFGALRAPSARRPWFAGAAVALAALELGAMAMNGPLRQLPRADSVDALGGDAIRRVEGARGRTFSSAQERFDDQRYMVESLRPNVNVYFDIPSIDGYDGGPAVRARWADTMRAFSDGPLNTDLTLRAQLHEPLSTELFARFGVRWVLADTSVVRARRQVPGWADTGLTDGPDDELHLFENPDYDGEAFVYFATRRVPDGFGLTLSKLRAADLRRVALVGPDGPALTCEAPCDRRPQTVRRPSPERIEITTSADRRGVATVPEQADDGWTVTVDGENADLVAVDGFSLGVEVSAGRHEIVFEYRAPGLVAGGVISLVALAGIGVLIVDPRRRSRAARRSD
jgi:hypothetical protein